MPASPVFSYKLPITRRTVHAVAYARCELRQSHTRDHNIFLRGEDFARVIVRKAHNKSCGYLSWIVLSNNFRLCFTWISEMPPYLVDVDCKGIFLLVHVKQSQKWFGRNTGKKCSCRFWLTIHETSPQLLLWTSRTIIRAVSPRRKLLWSRVCHCRTRSSHRA